ncbi:MAG TPA: STAS domain-containing protein [Nocardioides sp.]|nr:STAS domain-containing protein [Nocardioides sp.]
MGRATDLVTTTTTSDGKAVIAVRGEVDLVSCDELRRVVDDALQISSHVVLDLTDLLFIDSSGLSVLVEAHRKARDAGGVLVVQNPTPMLSRLLDITRLDTLLVIETSESAPSNDRG